MKKRRKKLVTLLLALNCSFILAQNGSEDYHSFLYSFGLVYYTDNIFSDQVMDKRTGTMLTATGYFFNNCYLRASRGNSKAKLKNSISIDDKVVQKGEDFYLSYMNLCFGYAIDLAKGLQLSAYSGISLDEFSIGEKKDKVYKSKAGIPLGIDLNYKIDLTKKYKHYLVLYLNNSINYSRLYQISEQFGNSYYSYEFGLGFYHIVELKKKSKRKKDKTE